MSNIQIIKSISIFSLVIAAIISIFDYLNLLGEHRLFTWISFFFFWILTIAVLSLANLSKPMNNTQQGSFVILGAMGFKFMLSLGLIVVYALVAKPAMTFLIPFFFLYVAYSVLETKYLLSISKVTK